MKLSDWIIEHGPYDAAVHPRYGAQTYSHTGAELNELRDELIALRRVTTYEEWRVTGIRAGEPFSEEWGRDEDAARARIVHARLIGNFSDGPHLHKRTVTVTEWTEVDA